MFAIDIDFALHGEKGAIIQVACSRSRRYLQGWKMKKVLYFKALHILMDPKPSNFREKKNYQLSRVHFRWLIKHLQKCLEQSFSGNSVETIPIKKIKKKKKGAPAKYKRCFIQSVSNKSHAYQKDSRKRIDNTNLSLSPGVECH